MTKVDRDFDTNHRCVQLDARYEQLSRQRVILDCIHAQADKIKQRELETGFTRLEAQGELTDEQRAIIEGLANALIAELLETPTKHLQNGRVTRSDLQTAAELFLSRASDE